MTVYPSKSRTFFGEARNATQQQLTRDDSPNGIEVLYLELNYLGRFRRAGRPDAYNSAMISVQDGQNRILTQITRSTSPEFLPLGKTLGRVVAEDVRAPFDVPPTDNSAVDGYAVGSADIPATGTRDLRGVAHLPAGPVFDGAPAARATRRVMTGAPLGRGPRTLHP